MDDETLGCVTARRLRGQDRPKQDVAEGSDSPGRYDNMRCPPSDGASEGVALQGSAEGSDLIPAPRSSDDTDASHNATPGGWAGSGEDGHGELPAPKTGHRAQKGRRGGARLGKGRGVPTEEERDARITAMVAGWPAVTEKQRERLALLLRRP